MYTMQMYNVMYMYYIVIISKQDLVISQCIKTGWIWTTATYYYSLASNMVHTSNKIVTQRELQLLSCPLTDGSSEWEIDERWNHRDYKEYFIHLCTLCKCTISCTCITL